MAPIRRPRIATLSPKGKRWQGISDDPQNLGPKVPVSATDRPASTRRAWASRLRGRNSLFKGARNKRVIKIGGFFQF